MLADLQRTLGVAAGIRLVEIPVETPSKTELAEAGAAPARLGRYHVLGLIRRGDCDGDGRVTGGVTDAVFLLEFSFFSGPEPSCLAACDANGDGRAVGAATDAIYLLTFNFLEGPPPPEPFPDCGLGGAADAVLGCETSPLSCTPGG